MSQSFANQALTGPLAILVELLRVLCTGSLDAYQAYEGENEIISIFITRSVGSAVQCT